MRSSVRALLSFSLIVCAPAVTFADTDEAGDSDSDGAKPEGTHESANPEAKQLPSNASDIAKQNAFGQQGARMKAAHAAAQAAGEDEANDEADADDGPKGAKHSKHSKDHGHGHGNHGHGAHGGGAGAAAASHGHGHGHGHSRR